MRLNRVSGYANLIVIQMHRKDHDSLLMCDFLFLIIIRGIQEWYVAGRQYRNGE
jgi:hypothetical protein